MAATYSSEALELLREFRSFLDGGAARLGGPQAAVRPPGRVPFDWPRKPVSSRYHIPHSAWEPGLTLEADGESFSVLTARTPYGIFGRCEHFWAEARGANERAMTANLLEECEPLWARQRAIGAALGSPGRCETPIEDLRPIDQLRLLYCSERDVAFEATGCIERHTSRGIWGPSLLAVLSDKTHPLRRQAQWSVLDLFEDLAGFFREPDQLAEALTTLESYLWDCEDDYARSCYKCGDVLGDHVADDRAADLLLRVLADAPSRIGRRSAIHGLIHVTEWLPGRASEIASALHVASDSDPEPLLWEYAQVAIADIEAGAPGLHPHGPEPVFPGE